MPFSREGFWMNHWSRIVIGCVLLAASFGTIAQTDVQKERCSEQAHMVASIVQAVQRGTGPQIVVSAFIGPDSPKAYVPWINSQYEELSKDARTYRTSPDAVGFEYGNQCLADPGKFLVVSTIDGKR
jgi:hypothetical protein